VGYLVKKDGRYVRETTDRLYMEPRQARATRFSRKDARHWAFYIGGDPVRLVARSA